MTRVRGLIFVVMLFLVGVETEAGKTGEVVKWRTVLAEDFQSGVLDTNIWRIEDTAPNKNNELEYYAPDEVMVSNGCLVLRSRRRAMGGREYTSGLVDSRDRFAQAYGKFEVRVKLPHGQGIWPAIWMLPADGSWPPEIDIVELIGDDVHTVNMTHHWGHWPGVEADGDIYNGPDFTKDFHTYGVEWLPERITWTVDGVARFTSSNHVPGKAMYLIFNTAVGGDWPGEPDGTTPFPVYHYVDWVRVAMPVEKGRCYLGLAGRGCRVEHTPAEWVFPRGRTVSIRAVPEIGYRFSHWEGDAEGTNNPLVVVMDANRRITGVCEPDPNAPLLLSRGARATASSVEKEDLGPEKAVDGDMRTRWSSEFADPQWLMLDLGRKCRLEAVRLKWETAYGARYEIQVSDDGRTWKTIYRRSHGRGGVERVQGLAERARYVRMIGRRRGTEWGYSLWEFEVFGRPETNAVEVESAGSAAGAGKAQSPGEATR